MYFCRWDRFHHPPSPVSAKGADCPWCSKRKPWANKRQIRSGKLRFHPKIEITGNILHVDASEILHDLPKEIKEWDMIYTYQLVSRISSINSLRPANCDQIALIFQCGWIKSIWQQKYMAFLEKQKFNGRKFRCDYDVHIFRGVWLRNPKFLKGNSEKQHNKSD